MVFGEIQYHLHQIRSSTIKCQYSGILGAPERHTRVWKMFLRLPVPEVGIGSPVHKMAHRTWEGALLGVTTKTSFPTDCRRHENFHVSYIQGLFGFFNWKINSLSCFFSKVINKIEIIFLLF